MAIVLSIWRADYRTSGTDQKEAPGSWVLDLDDSFRRVVDGYCRAGCFKVYNPVFICCMNAYSL